VYILPLGLVKVRSYCERESSSCFSVCHQPTLPASLRSFGESAMSTGYTNFEPSSEYRTTRWSLKYRVRRNQSDEVMHATTANAEVEAECLRCASK
jgi:hypothetical protein